LLLNIKLINHIKYVNIKMFEIKFSYFRLLKDAFF
jgi:hypothetical protein